LYLFPSSITVDGISQIVRESYDPNVLNEGLQKVIKSLELDYLFIDTHPGINEETLLSLTISDVLIIILRPDQQDFDGTAITVDVAQLLDVPHMFLVVNKALSRYDFKQVKEEVQSVYGVPVAGVLPLSEDIVDLASRDLFSLYDPNHPWSKGIKGVADAILSLD
jgi:MinD-like ATPase involved in chromosome partitioning or flagellar assembly